MGFWAYEPLFTAFVAASLMAISDDSAEASFPGTNGLIAFERHLIGQINAEIYVMNPDGGEPVNITNNAATDYAPAWSPDGSRIAFARNRDIFIMNADGSHAFPLTNDSAMDFAPAWSPDGSKIAFGSLHRQDDTGSHDGIYVMNCDGGSVRLLVEKSLFGFDGPDWSPDGARIAFGSDELFVMNADGGNLAQLTHDGSTTDLAPSWSPDGSKIAFLGHGNNSYFDVYITNPDGRSRANVTNHSAGEDGVAWSRTEGASPSSATGTATRKST